MAEDAFGPALRAEERHALVERGSRRKYRQDAYLFREGERSDHVVLVLSGRVKVSYLAPDGREVLLAIRGSGELLGELSALDRERRSADAAAIEPVEAVSIGADEFRLFLADTPRVALVLLEMLSRRLRDSDRKRIEFGTHDSVGRVARRLVELAERFGEPEGPGVRITLRLSQEELAGWTGSSREAVARALASLRRRGLIETGRRSIVVQDLDALMRTAAG